MINETIPEIAENRFLIPYKDGFLPAIKLEPSSKPKDIIVWHGGFDSLLEEMYPMLKIFCDAGFLIIAFEGPGQGGALRTHNLKMTYDWEKPISVVLDFFDVKKCVLIGMSLGGYMSLAFYYKYPEMVDSLLIIDTGPGFKNAEAREGWNNYALKQAKKFDEVGLDSLIGKSKEMNPLNHRNAKGLVHAAKGMLTQKDDRIINELPNIKVPSLIVVGEHDKPFLAAADYMEKKIKNSIKIITKMLQWLKVFKKLLMQQKTIKIHSLSEEEKFIKLL